MCRTKHTGCAGSGRRRASRALGQPCVRRTTQKMRKISSAEEDTDLESDSSCPVRPSGSHWQLGSAARNIYAQETRSNDDDPFVAVQSIAEAMSAADSPSGPGCVGNGQDCPDGCRVADRWEGRIAETRVGSDPGLIRHLFLTCTLQIVTWIVCDWPRGWRPCTVLEAARPPPGRGTQKTAVVRQVGREEALPGDTSTISRPLDPKGVPKCPQSRAKCVEDRPRWFGRSLTKSRLPPTFPFLPACLFLLEGRPVELSTFDRTPSSGCLASPPPTPPHC